MEENDRVTEEAAARYERQVEATKARLKAERAEQRRKEEAAKKKRGEELRLEL